MVRDRMRTFGKIKLVIHAPINEGEKYTLAQTVAEIHLDAVLQRLNKCLLSAAEKQKIVDALIKK